MFDLFYYFAFSVSASSSLTGSMTALLARTGPMRFFRPSEHAVIIYVLTDDVPHA